MAEHIVFKEENKGIFYRDWRKFVLANKISPRYLPSYIDWILKIAYERASPVSDKSFIYFVNNEIAACVLLPLERIGGNMVASTGGDYIFAPLVPDHLLRKKVFSLIDGIAEENKVAKIMFSADTFDTGERYNYLQKYGYLDASLLTYMIDLKTADDLLEACRKGHRQSIVKILDDKDFSVFIIDENNFSNDLFDEYITLHHKCSGKETRSRESFYMQLDRIKTGNAVLAGLKYKEKNVAFCYFDVHADKATYSSGADDPDYDQFFLYHPLLYKAMEYFKSRGVKYIDTNQPSSPSAQFDYYPDRKQLNIALFKRGFGGDFHSQFRGIKYFSKAAFEEDADIFKAKYGVTISDV